MKNSCEFSWDKASLIMSAKLGDTHSMEVVLDGCRPLIYSLVGRMHCVHSMREELIQAGYVGVLRAVRRFDAAYENRFITYALPWILGEIRTVLRMNNQNTATMSLENDYGYDGRTLEECLPGKEGIDLAGIDLRMALETLSDDERTLICLRFFRDKTQKETALLLHRSQTQISRMEQRILDRLYDMLR